MEYSKETIPVESETPCYCCHRKHRKLFGIDGYWMGRNCAEDYKKFLRWPKRDSIAWLGWEKKYDQIKAMVNSK